MNKLGIKWNRELILKVGKNFLEKEFEISMWIFFIWRKEKSFQISSKSVVGDFWILIGILKFDMQKLKIVIKIQKDSSLEKTFW